MNDKYTAEIFNKLPGVSEVKLEPIYDRVMATDSTVPFSWMSGFGAHEVIIDTGYVDITITSDYGETRRWTYKKEKAERFMKRVMEMSRNT